VHKAVTVNYGRQLVISAAGGRLFYYELN